MTRRPLAAVLAFVGTLAMGSPAYAVPPPVDQATLALNPGQGPPNSTITFSGTGFCVTTACGPVSVRFAGTPVATGITPDGKGAIHGTFEVPPSPAGSQRVVASQVEGARSATALFFVAPNLPAPATPKATSTFTPPSASAPERAGSPAPTTPVPGEASAASTETAGAVPVTTGQATDRHSPATRTWPWLVLVAAVLAAGGAAAAIYVSRRRRNEAPEP